MSETIKEARLVRDGDIIELDGKRGTVQLMFQHDNDSNKPYTVYLDILTDDNKNFVKEVLSNEPIRVFYERDYNTYQIRIEEREIVSIYRITHIPETGEQHENLVAKFFDGDLIAKYKLAQLLCVELEKKS